MSILGNLGKKKTSTEEGREKLDKNKMVASDISIINVLNELDEVNKRLDVIENYIKEILAQITESKERDSVFKQNDIKKENINVAIKKKQQIEIPKATIDKKDIIDDEAPKVVEFEMKTPESIYLPSPFAYNKFSVEDASKSIVNGSLYRIVLDSSSDQIGEIHILENADFAQALNSPKQFLELVCDYQNSYSNTAKLIESVENGKVKKEGDDWVVTERMLIKFI